MADSNSKVVAGGGYVENPDHIPNPADLTGQFNTSGTGAHQNYDAYTDVFKVDRQNVADQALRALDPKDSSVASSQVVLPNMYESNTEAVKRLTAQAESITSSPAVVGEPGPAEQAAGDESETRTLPVEGGTPTASAEPVQFTSTANQANPSVKNDVKADAKDDSKDAIKADVKADVKLK